MKKVFFLFVGMTSARQSRRLLLGLLMLCMIPELIATHSADGTRTVHASNAKIKLIESILTCDSQTFKKSLDISKTSFNAEELKLLQSELSQISYRLKLQKEQAVAKCLDKVWQRGIAGLCSIPEAVFSLICFRAVIVHLLLIFNKGAIINFFANSAGSAYFAHHALQNFWYAGMLVRNIWLMISKVLMK